MAKGRFSFRIDEATIKAIEREAQARAEKLGLSGYAASSGAYVRDLLPFGRAVIILRDGLQVEEQTRQEILDDSFWRGAEMATRALTQPTEK